MRAFLFILILAAVAWGANVFYQERKEIYDEVPPPPVITDSAPLAASEKVDTGPMIPEHLKWTLDPRWQAAEEEGEKGMKRALKLYEWQEEEGGDPLRFRREKEELVHLFQPIIAGLEEMKRENISNIGIVGNLQKKIDRFSAAISGVLR
jgi:hypothetical protein